MTPPLLCKCGHPRSVHDTGSGLEPCKPSCGCTEFRLDVRSRISSEDEDTAQAGAA